MPTKKSLTKEDLIKRLKVIAADETPRSYNMGAMCYSIVFPPPELIKCDKCGKEIEIANIYNHEDMMKNQGRIRSRGYGANIQCLCGICADKFFEENKPELTPKKRQKYILYEGPNYVFSFRISNDMPYHSIIIDYEDSFDCLLAFLDNESKYSGSYGKTYYVADNIKMLARMTGIKELSKIKSVPELIAKEIKKVEKLLSDGNISETEANKRIIELNDRIIKIMHPDWQR